MKKNQGIMKTAILLLMFLLVGCVADAPIESAGVQAETLQDSAAFLESIGPAGTSCYGAAPEPTSAEDPEAAAAAEALRALTGAPTTQGMSCEMYRCGYCCSEGGQQCCCVAFKCGCRLP